MTVIVVLDNDGVVKIAVGLLFRVGSDNDRLVHLAILDRGVLLGVVALGGRCLSSADIECLT